MKLTRRAAQAVCSEALGYGLVIGRIEGGIWHNPEFEPRLDCIWDGYDPPMDHLLACYNNALAEQYIRSSPLIHDVFVITAPPITGWRKSRLDV